ncbi:MAG: DNA-binding NarL/FixJ family response regulator [Pirellulaceae bacterium]|jgi:DNA-binding NarL/FixJ family response regulator
MKILYLDPDRNYARRLLAIFHKNGAAKWLVHYSRDLASGIARLQRERFDAVMIGTAKMDDGGIVAISSIKRKCPQYPIVVLTSLEHANQVLDSAANYVSDVLVREETEPTEVRLRVELAIAKSEKLQHDLRANKSMNDRSVVDAFRKDTSTAKVRVLQIEGNASYGHLLQSTLGKSGSNQFDVHRVSQLADGIKNLVERQYDAVLLDLNLPDCNASDTFARIQPYASDIPIVAITDNADEDMAKESVKSGFQDFLVKSQADIRGIERSLKMAVAKFRDRLPEPSSSRALPVLCANRRRRPSYRTDKSIVVIPVHGQAPGEPIEIDGAIANRKCGTLEFTLPECSQLPSSRLVVGILGEDELRYFGTVDVDACEPCQDGLRITIRFTEGIDDLLHPSNVVPKLDATSFKFGTAVSSEALNKWSSLGIIRPMIVDRVLVCPHCQGVPTFREGCVSCGSTRTVSTQMMRHRACSHVAPFDEFLKQHKVDCPKCGIANLVAGIDLDYVDGPYRCLDCEWTDSETTMVGQCMGCKERFLTPDALQLELIGYSCNRLKTEAVFRDPAEVSHTANKNEIPADLWLREREELSGYESAQNVEPPMRSPESYQNSNQGGDSNCSRKTRHAVPVDETATS